MLKAELTPDTTTSLPSELASPRAKLVYLYLDTTGQATADELAASLSMKKLAVLSVLRSLRSAGLVERTGDAFEPAA